MRAEPSGATRCRLIAGRPLAPGDVNPGNRERLAAQVADFIGELHAVPFVLVRELGLPSYPPDLAALWRRGGCRRVGEGAGVSGKGR